MELHRNNKFSFFLFCFFFFFYGLCTVMIEYRGVNCNSVNECRGSLLTWFVRRVRKPSVY